MPDDVQSAVSEAVAQALAVAIPQIVAALRAGVVVEDIPPVEFVAPDVELLRAEAAAVAAAKAERARWDAMPPDELAEHESVAARARLIDAIVDVLERDGDPGIVEELAEPLSADDVKACRAEAKRRLAGNATAQDVIDKGMKSRRDELAELLRSVNDGKASAEQRSRLVELVAR